MDKSTRRVIIVGIALGYLGMDAAFAKDVKIQGRVGMGAESTPGGEVDHQFEVRLGFESKRKKRVKAVIELRADEDGREASINDAFFDWKNKEKTSRIRAGRGKKILGWEYDYSTADRLSISRSLTYDFLANRAIVGRDYFVGYQWTSRRPLDSEGEEDGEEAKTGSKGSTGDLDSSPGDPTHLIDADERWKLGLDFHYDESRDSAFVAGATHTLNENWRLGAWMILQWTRGQYQVNDSLGTMISVLYQAGVHRAELEFFHGDDPYRTQLAKIYGAGRNIRADSVKAGYGIYLGPLNPYLVATMFWRDLDHRGDTTRQGIAGVRYFFNDDFSLAGEARLTKSESAFDTTSEPYSYATYAFLARYYF